MIGKYRRPLSRVPSLDFSLAVGDKSLIIVQQDLELSVA